MWMLMTMAMGCSNREVLLASGVYEADTSAGVVGVLSGVSEDVLSGFQIQIDVDSMTAVPFVNADNALPLTLTELETDEWQEGCPMPMIDVYNQTFAFSADFRIDSIDLTGAILYASGCLQRKGVQVEEAWLSTQIYQDSISAIGGMSGMLKLIKVSED